MQTVSATLEANSLSVCRGGYSRTPSENLIQQLINNTYPGRNRQGFSPLKLHPTKKSSASPSASPPLCVKKNTPYKKSSAPPPLAPLREPLQLIPPQELLCRHSFFALRLQLKHCDEAVGGRELDVVILIDKGARC
jgi:hypothetical protein